MAAKRPKGVTRHARRWEKSNMRMLKFVLCAIFSLVIVETAFAAKLPKLHEGMRFAEVRAKVAAAGWAIPSSAYCLSELAAEGSFFCMSIWPRSLYRKMPEFAGIATDVPIVSFQYSTVDKKCLEVSFRYDEDATAPFIYSRFEKSLRLVGPARMTNQDCYSL